jgi:hypothetical protein
MRRVIMFDLKWEIGVLLDCYAERVAKLDKYDFDGERNLKDLYAQAIILNTRKGYGLFYPIDDFIEEVRGGSYVDYDGTGYLLDSNGSKIDYVKCNVKFLEEEKEEGAVYVSWFNK